MLRFILVLISSFASVFIARSLEGAAANTHAVVFRAVDKISRRIMRKFAWTVIGICLFASGIVLSILDVSQMLQPELTLSLAMKLTLTLMGMAFLYAGLSVPKSFFPRSTSYQEPPPRRPEQYY